MGMGSFLEGMGDGTRLPGAMAGSMGATGIPERLPQGPAASRRWLMAGHLRVLKRRTLRGRFVLELRAGLGGL